MKLKRCMKIYDLNSHMSPETMWVVCETEQKGSSEMTFWVGISSGFRLAQTGVTILLSGHQLPAKCRLFQARQVWTSLFCGLGDDPGKRCLLWKHEDLYSIPRNHLRKKNIVFHFFHFVLCMCLLVRLGDVKMWKRNGGHAIHSWICGHTHTQRPEIDIRCLSQLLSTLFFEAASLTQCGTHWLG